MARGSLNALTDPDMKLDSGFLNLVTRIRDNYYSTDDRNAYLAALYNNYGTHYTTKMTAGGVQNVRRARLLRRAHPQRGTPARAALEIVQRATCLPAQLCASSTGHVPSRRCVLQVYIQMSAASYSSLSSQSIDLSAHAESSL